MGGAALVKRLGLKIQANSIWETKDVWKNAVIVICSFIFTFFGAEILLRNYVNPISIFGPWFIPTQNVKGFEWHFLQSYTPEQDLLSNFHPVYGWDHSVDGIRASGSEEDVRPDAQKILLVGDSFIYGSEVEAHQTIAAQIQDYLPNAHSINMGVPGFGIDQSFLKLIERGLDQNPDIVVFGVHPPNYERSTVNFYNRPKPIFNLATSGELQLAKPRRHLTSQELYDEVHNSRKHDLFVFNAFIKACYQTKLKFTDTDTNNFFEKYDLMVERIIRSAKTMTQEVGALFLVLQIPHGNRFRSPQDRYNLAEVYPLNRRLLNIYEAAEVEYIDLETEFMKAFEPKHIYEKLYTQPQGLDSAGHLTPLGSKITAKLVANKFREIR